MLGRSVDCVHGEGVPVGTWFVSWQGYTYLASFVRCLVVALHVWFVGDFVCAMHGLCLGNARPLLLSQCNTHTHTHTQVKRTHVSLRHVWISCDVRECKFVVFAQRGWHDTRMRMDRHASWSTLPTMAWREHKHDDHTGSMISIKMLRRAAYAC